jgi:hypothetical protein
MVFTTMQILGFIFEAGTAIAGGVGALAVYKKDPKYIGNRLMSLSNALVGLYGLCVLIYDLIATEWAIQIFIRLGLIAIFSACVYLYFTMGVLVNASVWYEKKKNLFPFIFGIGAFSLYIIISDFVHIIDIETANTQMDITPLLILIISVISLTLFSINKISTHGIKRTTGFQQKKLKMYRNGLIINVFAIIAFNIPSQLIEDTTLAALFDVLFFGALTIGVACMSMCFLIKDKKE